MITESYAERSGDDVLFRLAVDGSAVLDVLTDDATLAACREMLRGSAGRMEEIRLGSFGPFHVTVATNALDSTVSIFVDGPTLDDRFRGGQAAGVYVRREDLLNVLDTIVPEAV